jgi:magnesium transporter
MIRSFVFSEGKLAGENLDPDALKLVRADKGLHIWVDLFQPTAEETKLILEDVFNFHPLAIEDCLAVSHFPKAEDYEEYLFLVMHAVDFNRNEHFRTSEIDLFIGKEFLVTHHTVPLRSIDTTIERMKKTGAVARGPDRVAHVILDSMAEKYQPVLNELSREVQELEDAIFGEGARNDRHVTGEILQLRKDLSNLRQIIQPQREVVSRIAHGDFKMVRAVMLPYFRDVSDNLRRIDSGATRLSEQLYLALDIYLNKAQAQTNEVIKVLTLLTAVTTPLMVVGTWYGMNFRHMPELEGQHSYEIAAGIVLVTTVLLMVWMKWRKWI